MSAYAKALLYDLMGQYTGDNNGNLTVAFSALKDKGWRSKTTLWRSEKELINLKFVLKIKKYGIMLSLINLRMANYIMLTHILEQDLIKMVN